MKTYQGSLLRIAAFAQNSPGALLAIVNNQLCAGNDANMFVTLFCAVMDVVSGDLTYSNAGHLPPAHVRDSTVGSLALPKGPALGIFSDFSYANAQIRLESSDFILCFTDGITEAQTHRGEEFSENRLLALLDDRKHLPLVTLLDEIRGAVREFSGDQHLADDFTLMGVRRKEQ